MAHAKAGNRVEADRILEELKKRSSDDYISNGIFSMLYSNLGHDDKALYHLQKGYDIKEPAMIYMVPHWPIWEQIEDDPRFVSLKQKIINYKNLD